MARRGCELHADLTALAVMWFLRVLLNLHEVSGAGQPSRPLFSPSSARRRRADRLSRIQLVDRPAGQSARHSSVLLCAAANLGLGAAGASRKCGGFVDHVLCRLPFEAAWFREHGCNATFVGHPFFDEVRRQQLDQDFSRRARRRDGRLVTILPGSRTQEVDAESATGFSRRRRSCRPGAERSVCRSPLQTAPGRLSPASGSRQIGLPVEVMSDARRS